MVPVCLIVARSELYMYLQVLASASWPDHSQISCWTLGSYACWRCVNGRPNVLVFVAITVTKPSAPHDLVFSADLMRSLRLALVNFGGRWLGPLMLARLNSSRSVGGYGFRSALKNGHVDRDYIGIIDTDNEEVLHQGCVVMTRLFSTRAAESCSRSAPC